VQYHFIEARFDPGDEPVALTGNRDDVFMLITGLAERLSQVRDVGGQVALLNDRVRPDSTQQIILVDQVAAALYQSEQHLELLWVELDRFAGAEQEALLRVETERPELIGLMLLAHHF
jgi:hypothetical protein